MKKAFIAGVVYRLLCVLPKHERRVRLPPPAPIFFAKHRVFAVSPYPPCQNLRCPV